LEEDVLGIPILSGIVEGLKVFFKTRRYVAYLVIFVMTVFLSFFVSFLLSQTWVIGAPIETIVITTFAYLGATGTIYFMIGTVLLGLGLDKVWITRRGRGRVTEMKGVAWLAVSFAISVWMSIFFGQAILFVFAAFCWVGWIGFQGYLSSRTSLRIATIAEPKKGGIGTGVLAFIILIIGIGIIAAEAIVALVVIPADMFGISAMLGPVFPDFQTNITLHFPFLLAAFGLLGLFALISLLSYFRYATKGAAINISLLTLFISIYSGYFLVNVMRRTSAPSMEVADIAMSLFFLVYAMSGIGRTVTEGVEESKARTRDLGPLITFFLASGFFFVDSIISASGSGSAIGAWFFPGFWTADVNFATFLFRDIAKLLAFPLVATFTMLYYLRVERVDRIVDRARDEGEVFEEGEVDDEILEAAETPEEYEPKGEREPSDAVAPPDSRRLRVDETRRLGRAKRFGEEEDED
jgi:hypothetical protein